MSGKGYNGAGVYVFRARRPGFIGRIPVAGRHFAYVGESSHVRLRRRDHLEGSVKYNAFPKPWTDLAPTWYFLPLPGAPKFLLRSVETLLILLLWPVYNHQKNLWNPRRIPIKSAKRQRGQRDVLGWSFNVRFGHLILWMAFFVLMYANDGWRWLDALG